MTCKIAFNLKKNVCIIITVRNMCNCVCAYATTFFNIFSTNAYINSYSFRNLLKVTISVNFYARAHTHIRTYIHMSLDMPSRLSPVVFEYNEEYNYLYIYIIYIN